MHLSYRNQLLDGFFRRLQTHPDDTALLDTRGRAHTFVELFIQSETQRQHLVTQGFASGDRAVLLGVPSFELFSFVIAVLRLGGVLVLADPGMGRDVFRSRMTASAPRWVYMDTTLRRVQRHPILRWFLARRGAYIPSMNDVPAARMLTTVARQKLAMTIPDLQHVTSMTLDLPPLPTTQEQAIVFTSGTTAEPKGVAHTVGSLAASLELIQGFCSFSELSTVYTSLPYFLLIAIASGVRVQLSPRTFFARKWKQDIDRGQPTHIFSAPSEMNAVANLYKQHGVCLPSSLRQIMLGSAPVTRPVLEHVLDRVDDKTAVTGIYGLTEMLPVALVDGRRKLQTDTAGDLLGELLPGVHGETAPDGELLVSAPHMSPHYLGQPDAKHIATGDVVTLHDRTVILVGRKKDMIIRGNFNIYPRLYESTIERMPGVAACAMIGVWDERQHDERVVLVVEPQPAYQLNLEAEVRKHLRQPAFSIDAVALPDEILVMTLPRSGRQSKIDKQKVRAMISTRS